MLKAVFFDLDNTLIDRDAAHAAWSLQRVGAAGITDAASLVAEMLRRDGGGYGDRRRYFEWVAAALGLGIEGDALFDDHQQTIADFIPAHLGSRRLLEYLKHKARVAVVTNGRGATQRAKMRAACLDDVVDAVFVSADVGFHKPDRRLFAHALAAVGVSPAEALFVGDDPARDIEGARQAGMHTCWLQRANAFPADTDPPDLVIRSLDELVPAMRERWSCIHVS